MNPEILLLDIKGAAKALAVSTRSVQRLIENKQIPITRVRRSVRIPVEAIRHFVAQNTTPAHNDGCAGLDVRDQEKSTCHTNAKIVQFGGRVSPTKAAKELDKLLERPTGRRPKP